MREEIIIAMQQMIQNIISKPVVIGSVPPLEGYAVGMVSGAPIETFRTLSTNESFPVLFNGKSADQNSVAADMEKVHRILTTSKILPFTGEWQVYAIETTASSKGLFRFIDTAKEHGYTINLKYVTLVSSDLHVQRVHSRVQQGGHSVAEDDIVRRYDKAKKLLPIVLAKADRAELYDNSNERLLVLSKDQNKIKVAPTAELAGWSKERVRALFNDMQKEAPDLELDGGRSLRP